MKILELYSGIGGMHLALQMSQVPHASVLAAIDINDLANSVYKFNFPQTRVLNRNIQGLTKEFLLSLQVDTILMSPPCQPFTRNGLQKDIQDPRTDSFCSLLSILKDLPSIKRILIENVKGFETSQMHRFLITSLSDLGFCIKECLLSPDQFGVPNSRLRYYCVAKRTPDALEKGKMYETELITSLEGSYETFPIANIIQKESMSTKDYLLPLEVLKKWYMILDICYLDSKRSCCFTKSYGRYIKGTGSVFTDKTPEEVARVYDHIRNGCDFDEILKLNLRFFTPKEVSLLSSFPDTYKFPPNVSKKNCYMLLGNSINVKVVSELIKLLL